MSRPAALLLSAALALSACPKPTEKEASPAPAKAPAAATVQLDGKSVEVKWRDGDTFQIASGELAGTTARLSGFNTLEDYGPVHRWGDWTPEELYALARAPGATLSSRGWTCTSAGQRDKYKRLLVDCPGVAESLIAEGLAMVFAIDEAPSDRLVAAQQRAIEAKVGMWKKGAPQLLVTSLHSVDEGRGYNRVVDTRTGVAKVREHEEKYEVCQEVCEGPEGAASCMLYVPYERRYKDRAECLGPR